MQRSRFAATSHRFDDDFARAAEFDKDVSQNSFSATRVAVYIQVPI